MAARTRFVKRSLDDLHVGDLIRYKVLYQSRFGLITRVRRQGRIEALVRSVPSGLGVPAYIEGELRDEYGELQPFRLTSRERVYRQSSREVAAPATFGRREGVSGSGTSRDVGR